MYKFSITIKDIQHIKELKFSIDLVESGLYVIVGKNGVGKTMLFKGIQNLITSNTFKNTSNKYIYKENSTIKYTVMEDNLTQDYLFVYNEQIETLDFKGEIKESILNNIYVELAIPFGDRFKQFQKIAKFDREIRLKIISSNYKQPTKLIELLNYIYDTDRFENLREVEVKKEKYYVIVLDDDYYIREDYLSSGEYFIINIYKLIQKRCRFIAIDEIDISLDSMAQVRFVEKLRELSSEYNIKLLFSTHSLALIKTLHESELYYMELNDGVCSFENKSYNYIKSLLYGFQDYDKYILTEDEVLKAYIKFILKDVNIFTKYIILPIGGASNTVTLMNINEDKKVFENKENVCTVLDGDVKEEPFCKDKNNIYFLPFLSIEKELFKYLNDGNGFIDFTEEQLRMYNVSATPKAKEIYKMLLRQKLKTENNIFEFLTEKNMMEVENFKESLCVFLGKN